MAKENFKLIALSGTNGSGKDTAGALIAKNHGYLFFSVTELLREECRRRNIPIERVNERMISAEWRKEYGTGVLVDRAVEQYQKVKDQYEGLVLASIRNPGEADSVHDKGGLLVWLDADPKTRYARVHTTKQNRPDRSGKTYEQFLEDEKAEMHSNDPNKLSMLEVKKRCDIFIENEGGVSSLKEKIGKALFS